MNPAEALRLARRVAAGEEPEGCEGLYAALLELRVSFRKPASWYERALARVLLGVRRVGEGHWLVPGLPGDRYPLYNVWLGREGRYYCDCYVRLYGWRRRRAVCTHVASVMLARRWEELRRALAGDPGEAPRQGPYRVAGQRDGEHDERALGELAGEAPLHEHGAVEREG